MGFTHLHVASGYSARYGASHPEHLVRSSGRSSPRAPSPPGSASPAPRSPGACNTSPSPACRFDHPDFQERYEEQIANLAG
jgi:hypothetical protein